MRSSLLLVSTNRIADCFGFSQSEDATSEAVRKNCHMASHWIHENISKAVQVFLIIRVIQEFIILKRVKV